MGGFDTRLQIFIKRMLADFLIPDGFSITADEYRRTEVIIVQIIAENLLDTFLPAYRHFGGIRFNTGKNVEFVQIAESRGKFRHTILIQQNMIGA